MQTVKEQARQDKFLQIITALNKQHRQAANEIFDCGTLGFVHIWFHHSWECEWFKPSEEFKGK